MKETQDLKDFSISSWYEIFKDVSIKTIIINLPESISELIGSNDTDVDMLEVCPQDLITSIKNAINSLDKCAFVKNNWHAPMDAKMFSFGNTLKVNNIDDLFLYFQTSSILQEDFTNVKGVPFCIALKEWKNIHPAAEFRCIVISNVLRGITPRDWPTYYAHFNEEGPQIIESITNFYNQNVKHKFPRDSYIFDVVLSYPERPYLIDFSPLNNKSNLYAFSWQEIQPLMNKNTPEEVPPVFRYLESDIGITTKADALYKISQSRQ